MGVSGRPVLTVDQLKACRDAQEALLSHLEIAQQHGLELPAAVLQEAAAEIGRFHDSEEADKRARAIGDPMCPSGYR